MYIDLSSVYNAVAFTKESKEQTQIQDPESTILEKLLDSSSGMSDREKEKMNARIYAKLKSGKKLSVKEEQFLRSTNPQLYAQYLRIRAMADSMENRLKQARSKEEANQIITSALSSVSDKDPYKQYVVAALDETAKEFKKSDAYAKLPDKKEDAKKQKGSGQGKEDPDVSADSDDFDPMTWSPLQEIIDAQPTFHMSA
jgi:hypothetical protein